MKKGILILPLLIIIISIFSISVIGVTTNEDEIVSECNLKDYVEDCARIVIGTGVLCIKCTTEEVISLSTCLDIWHSKCLSNADCASDETCDISQDICIPEEDEEGGGSPWVEEYTFCPEDWRCTQWTACILNQQTRTCSDYNICNNIDLFIEKPNETRSCTPPTIPTCSDGWQNQGEEGVDCGGPCFSCVDCYDEIKNCHSGGCETDVDCGGPCMPCVLEKASKTVTFWLIFIAAILVIIILIIGLWYWKLSKGATEVGKQISKFKRKPPTQPSSLLRI